MPFTLSLAPQRYMAPGVSRTSWTPNTQFRWVTDFDSWDRCVSRGFPASMFPFRYNNGIRVFQSPGTCSVGPASKSYSTSSHGSAGLRSRKKPSERGW